VRGELGPDHSRGISIEFDIARCLRARSEYDRVGRTYDDLEPRIRRTFGAESVFAAILLRDRGLLDLARGRSAVAEPRLRQALDLHLKLQGPRHFRVPSFRHGLARALTANGKFDEAERQLRQIIALFPASTTYPHVEVSNALTTLAAVLRRSGRLDEARAALDEARDIILRTAGERSLEMNRAMAEARLLDEASSGRDQASLPR
jgi:tetratricopeptide (TPR) repeat protein